MFLSYYRLVLLNIVITGYLWKCNFETSDGSSTMCDLEQERRADKFDWTLWHGNTPSKETGPKAAFDGEYYIYIEASKRTKRDDAMYDYVEKNTNTTTRAYIHAYIQHTYKHIYARVLAYKYTINY